jgi:hypothetical protein
MYGVRSRRDKEPIVSQILRNYTKAVYGFDAVVQRVESERWDG